jgi:hypothetical protein
MRQVPGHEVKKKSATQTLPRRGGVERLAAALGERELRNLEAFRKRLGLRAGGEDDRDGECGEAECVHSFVNTMSARMSGR